MAKRQTKATTPENDFRLQSIEDLKPDGRNPRSITPENLERLKKSIARFGDLGGIVFNKTSGTLITGHQRIKVLESMGETRIDTARGVIVTGTGEEFPVRVVEWDEKTAAAAMLVANARGAQGEFLVDATQDLLNSLEESKEFFQGFTDSAFMGAFQVEAEKKVNEAANAKPLYEQSVQLRPAKEYLVIVFEDAEEFDQAKAELKLKMVRRGGYKIGSPFDASSIERVLPWKRVIGCLPGRTEANPEAGTPV